MSLFTDLYQLTMAQAYLHEGLTEPAVFELFYRELPENRDRIIAAGLDDVLAFLESLKFAEQELAYVGEQSEFTATFLDQLSRMSFTGDVYAVPEGTYVFPNEPIVQVIAPLPEAQIAETLILNEVHFQSIAATKATRIDGPPRFDAIRTEFADERKRWRGLDPVETSLEISEAVQRDRARVRQFYETS